MGFAARLKTSLVLSAKRDSIVGTELVERELLCSKL